MLDPQNRPQRNVASNGETGHPVAKGLLAGAAIGVGVGLLFAPRKGSEVRHQLAESCHHAYCACRDALAHGAQSSSRYVRRMADTMKRRTGRSSPLDVTDDAPTDILMHS